MAGKYEGTLTSLKVHAEVSVLEILLHRCGASLTCLAFDCVGQLHCPLAIIAATCPRLVALTLRVYQFVKDTTASFTACTELKELVLDISPSSVTGRVVLQGIIDHKLRLRTLTVARGFSEEDVAWFCQQAKDYQLLPVPTTILLPIGSI